MVKNTRGKLYKRKVLVGLKGGTPGKKRGRQRKQNKIKETNSVGGTQKENGRLAP